MTASNRSRFIPNSLALMFQTVFGAVVALVQVKVLANTLPQDTFGLFASLRGLALILAILAANGLPQLLLRYLPVFESIGARRRALAMGGLCMAVASVLVVVLLAGMRVLQARILSFAGPGGLSPEMFFWFSVYAVSIALKMVAFGGLNGLRRHTLQVALELIAGLVALGLIITLREGLTLLALMRILALVHGVAALAALAVLLKRIYAGVAAVPGASAPADGAYGSYFLWASALSFVSFTFTDVDRYILARVLTLEMLALFDIAVRPIRLANRFLCVSNLALQPEVTRWLTERRPERVDLVTRVFLKLNCALAVIVAVAVALFAREVILAISSRAYASAAPLLILLTPCLPLSTMTAPLTTVMKASNRVRDALISDTAWAATYVVLLFALGSRFGLRGVAAAQVIACVVQLLIAVGRSQLSVSVALVARFCARLTAVAAVAFAPAVLLAAGNAGGGGWAAVLLRLVLFLVGSGALLRYIQMSGILSQPEREVLTLVLAKRFPSLPRIFR